MVRPTYFDLEQSTNPLIDPRDPVSTARVIEQWERLRNLYTGLGHEVSEIPPRPGLTDMVFTTNAATVCGGKALVARFRHPQRAAESAIYLDWFRDRGYETVRQATWINEGERDHLFAGPRMLAAAGLWANARAHAEMREFFGVPVLALTLVDPRYPRLDTALAVLDETTVMYYPPAFSPESRALLATLYPQAIATSAENAAAYGLCAVSDGHHVILPDTAGGLATELLAHGFNPIAADLSELIRAGGGIRSCTLELHQGNLAPSPLGWER